MHVPKGFFITLEGGEGSGKSTLLNLIAEKLTLRGLDVVKTREPGGTKLGEMIRNWLLSPAGDYKIGNQAELLLFLAARAQHIEELIRPSLDAGKVVLCDRFNDSTVAYQGAARHLDPKYVQQLCHMICGPTVPQLTLFLDVDPKVGLLRSQKLDKDHAASGKFDRIEAEKIEFHERVHQAFRDLAKREPFRIYRIDANKSKEAVFTEAMRAIDELILLPAQKKGNSEFGIRNSEKK
jgi:dTMP kinase